MGSRIGIDLGTTNSVAAFKFVNVEIVRNTAINSAPNRTLTPSIVAWSSGSIRVGEPARQTRSSPENIIFSIKRLIGRGFNEQTVQDQIKRFPYKITTPTQGTDNGISVWLKGTSKNTGFSGSGNVISRVLAS